jgi:CDP-diacylglycerol--serine O-phosphatidyltransferase
VPSELGNRRAYYLREVKLLRHLPNVLTLSNLLLGTLAVLFGIQGQFLPIIYLMAACLLADILDGALARRLGVAGGLGIQLDSLADLVSFGVVPAILVFSISGSQTPVPSGVVHMLLAGLIATSAGLRLARFNVDTRPREYFWGLPTPAGAVMVAGLGWAVFTEQDYTLEPDMLVAIRFALPLFLAVMYQVPLKLPGLKSPMPGLYTLITVALLSVAGFIFIGPISITMGIFLYVFAGLLNLLVKWY